MSIEPLEKYVASKTPMKFKCKICGYEWSSRPNDILNGKGCPYCANKVGIRGKNDIATTDPDLVKYFVNREDTYAYSSKSNKKVLMKCPHCGMQKYKRIADLKDHGFGCTMCSDGISYPNKFIRAMLRQLPIENFIPEFSPVWAEGRSYDDYFEYNGKKVIVEMDGEFHYRNIKNSKWPLNKVQENDAFKTKLAVDHGIIVVRIESRKSNLDYLRINICKSKLNDILDLSAIDWKKCDQQSVDGKVKLVCDYFEANKFKEKKKDIATHFDIHISTLERYIKRGVRYGWCTDTERQYVY